MRHGKCALVSFRRWILPIFGFVLLIGAVSCSATDLMKDGKPGDWCAVGNGLPYYLVNAGQGALTVSCIPGEHKFRVRGTAKLLPAGKVYTDTEFTLTMDEGSIAREADAAGQADWGGLSAREQQSAEEFLKFCRAVAQYEAKAPVTEWETVDGEPARIMYKGTSGGSCGAYGTDLRFELLGDDPKTLYQLSPSGRYRVYGTIKVVQTGQTCKNGWIDRDGKVISSEE